MSGAARPILRDGLVIAVTGIAFSLVANALSPEGLSLRRDYFRPAAPLTSSDRTAHSGGVAAVGGAEPNRTRRGLPVVAPDEMVALFRDPRYAEGRIVFVDARDAGNYAAGHIPGAYLFDHYHPGRTTAVVMAAAMVAERLVVYCSGGDCEDSELALLDLVSLGVPESKLAVYAAGITDWRRRGLPIERGERGSGESE